MTVETLRAMFTGGDPRTLQGVPEAIAEVTAQPARLAELFDCVCADDAVVRMRAADACEKLCRSHPDWFEPYRERMLTEMAQSQQPSVQWHLAQMLGEVPLTDQQRRRAAAVVRGQLASSTDWIVVNCALETLASLTRQGALQVDVLRDELQRFADDERKSIRSRVRKLSREFAPIE